MKKSTCMRQPFPKWPVVCKFTFQQLARDVGHSASALLLSILQILELGESWAGEQKSDSWGLNQGLMLELLFAALSGAQRPSGHYREKHHPWQDWNYGCFSKDSKGRQGFTRSSTGNTLSALRFAKICNRSSQILACFKSSAISRPCSLPMGHKYRH